MSRDVEDFIEVMNRWRTFFNQGADLPVIGASEEERNFLKQQSMEVIATAHARSIGEIFSAFLLRNFK